MDLSIAGCSCLVSVCSCENSSSTESDFRTDSSVSSSWLADFVRKLRLPLATIGFLIPSVAGSSLEATGRRPHNCQFLLITGR